MTPPTFANGFLALAQAGLIVATMPLARRLTTLRPVWRGVVGISGAMMTLYLWHLTALSLLGAAGIILGDGWLFSFEPGTTTWWLLRPPFFVVLGGITVLLATVFIVFEVNINRGPPPASPLIWIVGIGLAIASTGAMALEGLVDTDAVINWWIPGLTLAGAIALGAWPNREPSASGRESTRRAG